MKIGPIKSMWDISGFSLALIFVSLGSALTTKAILATAVLYCMGIYIYHKIFSEDALSGEDE